MINTPMSGKAIDKSLKAISDAENEDNNGLILYIKDGAIAFDTYDNLFDLAVWEDA